jgi:hypothetical protein
MTTVTTIRYKHEKSLRITNHNHPPLLRFNDQPNPPGEDYTEDFDTAPLYAEWINNDESYLPTGSSSHYLNDGHPMVFVHDFMGSHKNVQIVAQKLTRHPQTRSWGLLLDLTGHGQSVGRRLYKHVDLNFASYDLSTTTATEMQINGPNFHLVSLIAFGYGGRIALRYASQFDFFPRPTHMWLIDTKPSPPDESTWQIVHAVENVLKDHSIIRDRNHLAEILQTPPYGMDKTMARFLSAQYEKCYGDFIFDVPHIKSMLEDIAKQDFWTELTAALDHGIMVDLVQAEKDHPDWAESYPKIAKLRSRYTINFRHHVLNKSGRWLHVEDLDRLLALVQRRRKQQDFVGMGMFTKDDEVYLDGDEEECVENPPPLRLKKKKTKKKRKTPKDSLDFDFVDHL